MFVHKLNTQQYLNAMEKVVIMTAKTPKGI